MSAFLPSGKSIMVGPLQGMLERPLPFPSFVQSYSTLLPGLAGGQLVCGWRRTWESHPSEDRSELHRCFECIAMQKYHYRQMTSWRDSLPRLLLDERVSLGTFRFGACIDTGYPPCRWSWRVLRIAVLFSGGSSADVIQLPDMAVWRFSRYNQAVIIGSGVIVHRIQENPYSAVGRIGRPCRSNFFILTQIYQAVHEFGQSASWWMAAFGLSLSPKNQQRRSVNLPCQKEGRWTHHVCRVRSC